MIKNYKIFTESLLSKLEGPSEEEIFNNFKDLTPDDMLYKSIDIGFSKGIKKAINFGVNIDFNEAFCLSAESGHLDLVKFFHEKGAEVTNDDNYALKYSAENGHLDVVKYLIEHGADVHANNDYALRWSANNGYLDVVKYLVENGADIHVNSDVPLLNAVINGHLDVVKYLVENGSKITHKILRHAENNEFTDIVNYFNQQLDNGSIKESLLDKLEGPSEEEVIKNIENKYLEDQIKIFVENGYIKGILKIKKMFDKNYLNDEIEGFKNFKHLLKHTSFNTMDIINYPNVLELLDKEDVFNIYSIDHMIEECILTSKKESLDYLLKKYNKYAKERFSNEKNKIYLINPMLRKDFDIIEILLNNGIFDFDPYKFFSSAIKYGGEEMGELFIKKYNFSESLLNKLEGPSEEEIWDVIKQFKPVKMLNKSIQSGLIKGVELALKLEPELLNHKIILDNIVESDNSEMLKTYLKCGGVISDKDNYLLRVALEKRNYEMCKIIIDSLSEDLIISELTTIKLAAYGNYDIIKYFVDKFPKSAKMLLKNVENSFHNFGIEHTQKTKDYLQSKILSNESLLTKLEGPSKEEISKNLNFEIKFDNPEDFINDIINNIKVSKKRNNDIIFEKDGTDILLLRDADKYLFIDNELVWDILKKVYGLTVTESNVILGKMFSEYFGFRITPMYHLGLF